MSKQKRPRKPSQPIGHIVFSKEGSPYRVIESFPDLQEDLEASIVAKFIGALKHFEGRKLSVLTRGSEWPDFVALEENRHIGIEIVELVNVAHARMRDVQERYAKRVRELIDDIYPQLTGLSITLIDGYQNPPYPPLSKKAGQDLVRSISNHLKAAMEHLESLELNHVLLQIWQRGPTTPMTGAIIRRIALRETCSQATLRFESAFPESVADAESRLARTIEGKLTKCYPSYADGSLWLLAYEVFSMSVAPAPSEALSLARAILSSRPHPFAEVWYIFPYAGRSLGHIERIWP